MKKIYIIINLDKGTVIGVWTNLTKLTQSINNEKASYRKIYHKIKDLDDLDLINFQYSFLHNGEKHQIEIKFLNP